MHEPQRQPHNARADYYYYYCLFDQVTGAVVASAVARCDLATTWPLQSDQPAAEKKQKS